MKFISQPLLASLLIMMLLISRLLSFASDTKEVMPEPSALTKGQPVENSIKDLQTRAIVTTIMKKLAPIQAYRCKLETSPLDPNGGFDQLQGERFFRRPNHFAQKMKVLSMHNPDQVNSRIDTVFDGTWEWRCMTRPPMTEARKKEMEAMFKNLPEDSKKYFFEQEQKPSYIKTNLAAAAKAGYPVREYLAAQGDLLAPFGNYKMATLKLQKETATQWVFAAEPARHIYWKEERVTISKKSGTIERIEIEIKELGQTIALIKVKEFSPTSASDLPDAMFKMDVPKEARITDQTDMILMDLKYAKEAEKGKSAPAQK